jgi:hypothetical protein
MGNPASYSIKAIELCLEAKRRRSGGLVKPISTDTGSSSGAGERAAKLNDVLGDLFESERIKTLFEKGGRELLNSPQNKRFSLKELARLAGYPLGEACKTTFKDEMKSLKRADMFALGRGPYILTDFGRDLLRHFLKE